MLERVWREKNLPDTAGANVNWHSHHGNSMEVPKPPKTKDGVTRRTCKPTPGHISGEKHDLTGYTSQCSL